MKLKVFISSRNNDTIKIGRITGDSLTDIRLWLKEELEKIKMFDKDFLDIRINETFGATTTRDSYNECLDEVRKSDLIIALYNGVAGWAPTGIDLGICHSELSTALDISMRKTRIIHIEKYFEIKPADKAEETRNEKFKKYVEPLLRLTNPLKVTGKQTNDNFKETLLKSIKTFIYNHLSDRIKISNSYYSLSGTETVSLEAQVKHTCPELKVENRDERDDLVYIGSQVWSSKNLDVETYRNGDVIPQVQDKVAWDSQTTGAWCYYDNKASNGILYGKLYNWYAVNDPRGLAPRGYHIPTDAEWTQLSDYIGVEGEADTKLKSTRGWSIKHYDRNGTNSSGFSGLPGGWRQGGNFNAGERERAQWWSSTDLGCPDDSPWYQKFWWGWSDDSAWYYAIDNRVCLKRSYHWKNSGYSVRCIMD